MTPSASSQLNDGNAVEKVFDGLQGTQWLSAEGDELPTLTFNFDKPVRADTLVLGGANSSNFSRDTFDHPTRIAVYINKSRDPMFVEIAGGVLSSWPLNFKATRVRSIQIRILERNPGKTRPGIVGFSEVELLLDR